MFRFGWVLTGGRDGLLFKDGKAGGRARRRKAISEYCTHKEM